MPDFIPKDSLNQNKEDRPQQKSVVTAETKVKEKSLWQKIKDEFIMEDGKSVGDYILFDVLIPAAKSTLQSAINNTVDMILFGGYSGNRQKYYGSSYQASRPSYRPYYDQRNNDYYSSPRTSNGYDYTEIVFKTREDAEEVLFSMREWLGYYKNPVVRVADYLEFSGRKSAYTDNYYGWTNLDNVQIRRDRSGGYYLDLPRPMAID